MKRIILVTTAALAVVVATSSADAQSRRKSSEDVGQVTTCSTYGNGCTTAPIRRGRNGYEFRLPGGTWVECRQSCRNALREETVDFWETQKENQPF